ncbi:MAG: hypothetical protein O7D94_11585 [Planctomycetota bacterium]|nr:hypothetical protein [Planctomycetota bacterium]
MGPIERVKCVLEGRKPDRPPISFWYHFPPDQACGPAAVKAHVDHLEAFDLDFLKVMNDNRYPHDGRIECVADLASVTLLRGDEPEFTRQLDLIADLKRALHGRVLMATTLFNAWATLRHLVRPPRKKHRPPVMTGSADAPSNKIKEFFVEDPEAVKSALQRIGTSLARFARRCLEAGADGVFLSVRDDWLESSGGPPRLYDELVRSSDLEILDAASDGRFNLLHVCGTSVDFRRFAEYPVHVVNWADRAAGPSIAEVRAWVRPAICAGVDNLVTLAEGTIQDCDAEVKDALDQAGGHPIMIGPGCTYDPENVPRANLEAACRAVRR